MAQITHEDVAPARAHELRKQSSRQLLLHSDRQDDTANVTQFENPLLGNITTVFNVRYWYVLGLVSCWLAEFQDPETLSDGIVGRMMSHPTPDSRSPGHDMHFPWDRGY